MDDITFSHNGHAYFALAVVARAKSAIPDGLVDLASHRRRYRPKQSSVASKCETATQTNRCCRRSIDITTVPRNLSFQVLLVAFWKVPWFVIFILQSIKLKHFIRFYNISTTVFNGKDMLAQNSYDRLTKLGLLIDTTLKYLNLNLYET